MVSVKAVGVGQRDMRGRAAVVVAGQAIVGGGVQREDGGCAGGRPIGVGGGLGWGGADPRHAVIHAVLVVQVVDAGRELVSFANAVAVGGRNAPLVQTAPRPVVVGLGGHGVDAQGCAVAGFEVEVAYGAAVLVAAHRHVHQVLVDQAGHFGHHVHRTAGRATAKQQRGRAAQHLHAVEAERVALIERRIAHAVHKHVAGLLQREPPQADVFLAALGRQKADAAGGLQHLLHGVQVAVVHQLFGDDGDGLRNVAQRLTAFADGGFGGAKGVFALGRLGRFRHGHGAQRPLRRTRRRLGRRAHGAAQQQRTQRQQGRGAAWALQGVVEITGDGRAHWR